LEQKTGFEFLPLPLLIGTHTTSTYGAVENRPTLSFCYVIALIH